MAATVTKWFVETPCEQLTDVFSTVSLPVCDETIHKARFSAVVHHHIKSQLKSGTR